MSDLKHYIAERKMVDNEFAHGYDVGYEEFKLGVMLKELRLQKGLTQEELAEK
jgi:DNA-binding XRE family transcriptional regulator